MASKQISRDDLIILLSSMGVVLPDTKLLGDELNKKVGLAFDASQQLSTHLPSTPLVDPSTFPPWEVTKKGDGGDTSDSKTLYEATERRNVSEICEGVAELPKQGSRARKQDTFKEMRQSIMGIAFIFDEGVRDIFYVDETRMGILLKILDVRKVNKSIPLFLFEYKEVNLNPGDRRPAITVPILDLERRALLKLFHRNAKKLHDYTEQKRDADGGLGPPILRPSSLSIEYADLGQTHAEHRMSECQKKDWPDHKSACKSLKGGTWCTIKLSNLPGNPRHRTMINRLDPLSTGAGIYSQSKGDSIPSDEVHKGKIFLAKFQVALTESIPSNMMIYDRQRSFQLLWLRNSNPTLFDSATQMMAGQYKFYRWVKRVGQDEMEVCLDRPLPNNPIW